MYQAVQYSRPIDRLTVIAGCPRKAACLYCTSVVLVAHGAVGVGEGDRRQCQCMSSSPPAKRKKQHVDSKFQSDWSRFQMAPSKKGAKFAFCTICKVDVAIGGGGVHEVKRHCETVKHKRLLEDVNTQPSISSVMARASKDAMSEKVMKSELYFARFVAEHNLSFATVDHFTKVMFPDSKVADSFSCSRTKTTALVTHALAPSADDAVISACRKQKFSILCDGGNDNKTLASW